MAQPEKFVFVMFVYEVKDERGNFQNSVEVQLLDFDLKNAKARALKIAGTKDRKHIYIRTIIEQTKNDTA